MNDLAQTQAIQNRWVTPLLAAIVIAAIAGAVVKMWQSARLDTIENTTVAAHEIIALSEIHGAVTADFLTTSKQTPDRLTAREYWQSVANADDRCNAMAESDREVMKEPCTLAKVLLSTYGTPR